MPTTPDTPNSDLDRAAFYLSLAHAFRVPIEPDLARAMRDALADDLADLDRALAYGGHRDIADYRAALLRLPDDATLLAHYSRLFLAPPRPVHLNTAVYLDGACWGGSARSLECEYQARGLARDDRFHDLADHLSAQFEFAAHLYAHRASTADPAARAAEIFLARYPARWLPPFLADLERASVAPELSANPYLPLARLLRRAVGRDAAPPDEAFAPTSRQQRALARARRQRAGQAIGEADLEFIRARLRRAGLDETHLAPGWRANDPWRGWQVMTAPGPARQ